MYQAVNLHKKYGDHYAVRGLNLEVGPGEVFCLLGQNGAGKTTTINISLGFLKPTEGKVMVGGQEVRAGSSDTRKKLAYIPEVVMLYGDLTAVENLDFFCRLAGFQYTKQQLHAYLSDADLQKEAHHKRVKSFSKGMRQKVGIAIAAAKDAQVILMDEPTSGLDPKATDEFTRIVKRLAAEGRSVLIATHDIFNAVNTGTRIGIMKSGEMLHTIDAKDISPNQLQQLYLETV